MIYNNTMKTIIACEERVIYPIDPEGVEFELYSVICPLCLHIFTQDDCFYEYQDYVGNPIFLKGNS